MRSFAEVCPALVCEWSQENTFGPDQVSYGSNKPIIWNGVCGHTWTGTPKNRSNGHGCPVCSGNKIIAGINDFSTLFPKEANEWSDRNFPSAPQNYGAHSNQSFWWKCRSCGREWKARIADRSDGHGCPYCVKDNIEARKAQRILDARAERQRRHEERQEILKARQFSRTIKEYDFQKAALYFYASQAPLKVEYDFDPGIGIPVQLYFPEKCAAIEHTSYLNEGWKDWRFEKAKNWLCYNSGIKMIRILPPKMNAFANCKCVKIRYGTAECLNYALTQAFKKMRIPMDIDIVRDYDEIRRQKHDED